MGSHGLHWPKISAWEYYYSYHQVSWTRSKQSRLINDVRDNQSVDLDDNSS
jgi:hypothetical protein